jgi:hypothetical protein
MAERNRIFTGARARFMVEGKKVGWATGVNVDEAIEYQPARVLDNIEVEEHVPVAYDVSLSFETLTIVGQTLKSLGLFPKGGQAGPSSRLRNILTMGELSVGIEDNQTEQVQLLVTGVKIARQGIQIQAGNISGTNVTAVGKAVRDASEM